MTSNRQQSMFPHGDDLPLFSGAPVAGRKRHLRPEPNPATQPAMLDLCPVFGASEPDYTPKAEAQP